MELIEGDYDTEAWLDATRGHDDEPEKGKRCALCFDNRLENTAKKAQELGEESMTTTLLTSPKKSFPQLVAEGTKSADKYGIKFIAIDLKLAGGTQRQNEIAKEDLLYRQNYCGCLYALGKQRNEQNLYAKELISPITQIVQPNSIEEKIETYEKIIDLEEKKIAFKTNKVSFINYRLLRAYLRVKKEIVPSYFLHFSTLKNEYTRGKIEYEHNDVHYFGRSEVKFLDLKTFNSYLLTEFISIKSLIKIGLDVKQEMQVRSHIDHDPYSKSTIIIVEEVNFKKAEIYCKSETFDDVKENLVIFS